MRYNTPKNSTMPPATNDITKLLQEWRTGSPTAEADLFALVLPQLRRLAGQLMHKERKGHTLQPTELVDQIYIRLVSAKDRDWQNRQHFFAIAARAMRRYLIDHARGRPKVDFVELEGLQERLAANTPRGVTALMVDTLLEELAVNNPEWCQIIELRYFLGLSNEEAAAAMGMNLRTLQRRWRDARRWLFERMESADAGRPE